MIRIDKDRKGRTWIITRTDEEGYHRQINVTMEDMREMSKEIERILNYGMEEDEGV